MAVKSAKPATSEQHTRSRVIARARARRVKIRVGDPSHSTLAPASARTITSAVRVLDAHRPQSNAMPSTSRPWPRRLAAGTGALALTVLCGVFTAAVIAGATFGIIVAILNTHR